MHIYMHNFYLTTVLSIMVSSATANTDPTDITEISLEQLLDVEVFTASKFNQKMSEAPSRVSVITAEDIKTYGHRTLKDIVNSISGLYTSSDHNYSYLGVRGFSVAGDYNSRVLVLLDGQRVNENIYHSAGLDFDGVVNVDLIKRVEFSSGPGSAVYGANAFFGVINIITKNPSEIDGAQATLEYASDNSRGAGVTAGKLFNNGGEALISAYTNKSDGSDRYYPEFDDPTTNNGIAKDLDYQNSNNLFVKLKLANWGFETTYNERTKGIPTASYGQAFNTSPSETTDKLSLAKLTYEATIDSSSQINSNLTFGRYKYAGNYVYDYPPITVNRDVTLGEWWGLDARYQTTHFNSQRIIIGMEYTNDNKQQQANYDIDPFFIYLDDSHYTERYGVYLQDEIRLSNKIILNAGLRYDNNNVNSGTGNIEKSIINPRLAFIFSPQQETTLKLIYGTAYRNANAYELYYGSALGYLPNYNLEPEEIETYEIDIEHYFMNNFKITTSVYSNNTTNLIGLNSDPVSGDLFFDNVDKVKAQGIDVEAEYIYDSDIRLRTSYSYVNATDQTTGSKLTNSPSHMAKINMTAPIFQKKARVGIEVQYMSDRLTVQGDEADSFAITNLTLSNQTMLDRLELSASIYNLFDKQYFDPASEEHMQSAIEQNGRNFRVKATYTF